MEQWDVAELHLMVEDSTLDLVRAVPTASAGEIASAPMTPGVAPVESGGGGTEVAETEPVIIQAPVVGTFHLTRRGFPHGAPRPGDAVQAGQVIGSIDLMHIPTDLISPVSGTLTTILADDDTGVEYGQRLMVIHPFEEVSEDEAGMLPPPVR